MVEIPRDEIGDRQNEQIDLVVMSTHTRTTAKMLWLAVATKSAQSKKLEDEIEDGNVASSTSKPTESIV